jgi:hypothetical protein
LKEGEGLAFKYVLRHSWGYLRRSADCKSYSLIVR